MSDDPRRLNSRDVQLLMDILKKQGYVEVDKAPETQPTHKCEQCGWPGTRYGHAYCDPCESVLASVRNSMFFLEAQAELRHSQELRKRGLL
jgi:hypothetical protein